MSELHNILKKGISLNAFSNKPITAALCFPIWVYPGDVGLRLKHSYHVWTRLGPCLAGVNEWTENIQSWLTQAVSLHPTPKAGQETLSHCGTT